MTFMAGRPHYAASEQRFCLLCDKGPDVGCNRHSDKIIHKKRFRQETTEQVWLQIGFETVCSEGSVEIWFSGGLQMIGKNWLDL
jgi:hypothetical protein